MSAFCPVLTCTSLSPRCAAPAQPPTPSRRPTPRRGQARQPALPLARTETAVLLRRMLTLALSEEDFPRAAQLRDAQAALARQEPTHALRALLRAHLQNQDFRAAADVRDEIERLTMLRCAERAKPRFAMGLVVLHRRFGYRMIVFGVDYRCRAPRRKAEDAGVGLSLRGGEQPWYHAAVDERDKTEGDNIVYVAEDDLCAAGEGVEVRHPITRIMFSGWGECEGFSCYVPGCREEDDDDE